MSFHVQDYEIMYEFVCKLCPSHLDCNSGLQHCLHLLWMKKCPAIGQTIPCDNCCKCCASEGMLNFVGALGSGMSATISS